MAEAPERIKAEDEGEADHVEVEHIKLQEEDAELLDEELGDGDLWEDSDSQDSDEHEWKKQSKKRGRRGRRSSKAQKGVESNSDRLKKKKLAERARRERLRSDPRLYEQYKAKQRERYLKLKAENKIKSVRELSPREQQILRQRSRQNSKAYYQRKKMRMLQAAGVTSAPALPYHKPCPASRRPRPPPLPPHLALPSRVSMRENGIHYIITIS